LRNFEIENYLNKAVFVLSICMAIFHIYAIQFMPFSVDFLKNFHMFFALSIFYLMQINTHINNRLWLVIDVILLLACVSTTVYVGVFFVDIKEMMGIIDTTSLVFGVFLMVGVWEATRRKWGYIIPVFVLISLIYASFGYLCPPPFYHSGISFDRLVGYSTMFFRGIFGSITGLSASVVYILFIFAGLLDELGGRELFLRLGKNLSSKFRSGPALSAVFCSAFMGMVSGSAAANVATTGSFTIPMMKSVGYKPGYAGAVECVASTGGQFTPPILGASAFLMVALTGIPYVNIAIASILPAVLYYLYICLCVELRAQKENICALFEGERESSLAVVKENFNLIIPVFVLVCFLMLHYSAGLSAIYAMYALVVLTVIKNKMFTKKTLKNTVKEILKGFQKASMQAVSLVIFFACVNIAIEMLIVTGIAQKFSHIMISMSGGSLILLLILSAITAVIFGMGMPTPGAYILVALLGAPALVSAGSTLIVAHFFVLFYAILSCIIPPVATAPMVACGIAETSFWDVALKALKLGIPAFILPFYFVYRPGLLIINSNFTDTIVSFLFALIAILCLSICFEGFFMGVLKVWERIILGILALLLVVPNIFSSVLGGAGAIIFLLYLKLKGNKYRDVANIV